MIDLHTHSTASDGTQPPAEVVASAAAAGLDVLALTDHDTTAGWEEARSAATSLGIGLLPGAELSVEEEGLTLHLLAYLPDPSYSPLWREVARVKEDRLSRAKRMTALLSTDFPVSWERIQERAGSGTVGRPHLADELVAVGAVSSRDEAFASLLAKGSPYYLSHYAPPASLLLPLVLAAGGVPVLAHPRTRTRGRKLSLDALSSLVDLGLAGLEVDHREHSEEDRLALHAFAREHSLLTTGSSDYHGTGKQNRLGENTTSPEVLQEMLALASGTTPTL